MELNKFKSLYILYHDNKLSNSSKLKMKFRFFI